MARFPEYLLVALRALCFENTVGVVLSLAVVSGRFVDCGIAHLDEFRHCVRESLY